MTTEVLRPRRRNFAIDGSHWCEYCPRDPVRNVMSARKIRWPTCTKFCEKIPHADSTLHPSTIFDVLPRPRTETQRRDGGREEGRDTAAGLALRSCLGLWNSLGYQALSSSARARVLRFPYLSSKTFPTVAANLERSVAVVYPNCLYATWHLFKYILLPNLEKINSWNCSISRRWMESKTQLLSHLHLCIISGGGSDRHMIHDTLMIPNSR